MLRRNGAEGHRRPIRAALREGLPRIPESLRTIPRLRPGRRLSRQNAAFYYKKEDYARAIDVFENVLSDHPDANFLDVILFNYGRCLYKLKRKPEARRKFEQLINDYPESEIASEAHKIVEALKKAGF